MKKNIYLFQICLLMAACNGEPEEQKETFSPYVAKVYAYCPAPGQFVNELPAGQNQEEVLAAATEALVGGVNNGLITLGAWGGYVIVGFDHSIENVAGDYDFKVYGNSSSGCSEPGIVMVSSDENGNGYPDDTWYELAGSEYSNDSTIHHYRCVYYRPDPLDSDVLWKDNQGNEGYVTRNSYHTQNSYYPLWSTTDSLIFEGTILPSNAELRGTNYYLPGFDWGYADNLPNNSEGSCFDIDWAVDENGQSVSLKSIDFVKIYTAQQQCLGRIGETSTEIAGLEVGQGTGT